MNRGSSSTCVAMRGAAVESSEETLSDYLYIVGGTDTVGHHWTTLDAVGRRWTPLDTMGCCGTT